MNRKIWVSFRFGERRFFVKHRFVDCFVVKCFDFEMTSTNCLIDTPLPDPRLIGTTTPNYSGAGIMRGSVVKITIGDYLIQTPGVIKGFSIEPILDAGWEIARDFKGKPITNSQNIQQLPKAFKVCR